MPYANKAKQREYQREWCKKRRQEWLWENGPCTKCGSWENLEVDHKDPKTKIDHTENTSDRINVWSWSKERQAKELEKCQVLCYDCHLEKTISERPKTDHGRGWMYIKYKCRCSLCREWKRLDDRKRRRGGMAESDIAAPC